MKNKMKTIATAILACTLVAGVQMTAFAATSASEPDTDTISAIEENVVTQSEIDTASQRDGEAISSTANAINQSPNTGIAVAPFAAALLAAAAVPVMLGTRKKK